MRACARVALVLTALSVSVGLAGCGAIDDLRDAVSRCSMSANPRADPEGRLPTTYRTQPLCLHQRNR